MPHSTDTISLDGGPSRSNRSMRGGRPSPHDAGRAVPRAAMTRSRAAVGGSPRPRTGLRTEYGIRSRRRSESSRIASRNCRPTSRPRRRRGRNAVARHRADDDGPARGEPVPRPQRRPPHPGRSHRRHAAPRSGAGRPESGIGRGLGRPLLRAHLACVLLGEGPVELAGRRMEVGIAFQEVAVEPLRLEAKEGLALLNGTHPMAVRGSRPSSDSTTS